MKYKNKTVTKRADGRYVIRIQINKKTHYCYGKTEHEAIKKFKNLQKELFPNLDVEELKTYTLNEFFEKYINEYKKELKESSKINYKSNYNKNIKKEIGEEIINYISEKQIINLIEKIKTQCCKKATYLLLKDIFKHALKNKFILASPMTNIEMPKYKNPKQKSFISTNELKEFFEISKKIKTGMFFNFLLLTGMRIGEMLALQKKDFNLTEKTISIEKTKSQQNKIQITKTTNSNRVIPLPDLFIDYIKNIENENDYFCNYKYENLKKIFTRNYRKINKNLTIHSLRHSFASICFEKNIETKIIQYMLGHSNISTTLDTYTKISKQAMLKNNEKLNKIINELNIDY